MERRLQNSLWALGATLAVAALLGTLGPNQHHMPRLASPSVHDSAVVATGSVDATDPATPAAPRRHRSLRHHGLSMPYFSFSSSIGG